MIRLFGQTDKTFTSNGDVVLKPLKAKVHKSDNGDFYLDLEVGLEYVDYFLEGNIVVANTPQGDQAFRIGNVDKNKNKLVSKCWHVFYDSENYVIADSNVVDKNCNDALNHLNNATETTSEFTTFSNITTINSYRCVRKSLYEAIQTVLERWGGHLVRNNFYIAIMSSIGTDNGITIQYKKNLADITCSENWDNVVTKILPVGQDGILLNAVDPSASIYIESDVQYDIPYTKVVDFTQDISQEDYPTETAYKTAVVNDLRAQATAYLAQNCLPEVNYTLKADLDRTTDVGDTIQVIDERLGVNLLTHVISYEYDCIFGKYSQVEFGNFTQSLSNLVSNMTATAVKVANEASQNASDQIIGMLSNSYVIYDGEKILIVDSLPKENATDVITIDHTGVGFSQSGLSGDQTSKWNIDGTMMLNGDDLSDFVKAQGETDGWMWKKYHSGTLEVWTQVEVDATEITWATFLTSLKSGDIEVAYPFDISNAVINATINDSGDIGWIAGANATDETKTTLSIVRETDTGTITINILVKGIESTETEPSE